MKKGYLILLFVTAIALSGCIRMEMGFTANSDNTGTYGYSTVYNMEVMPAEAIDDLLSESFEDKRATLTNMGLSPVTMEEMRFTVIDEMREEQRHQGVDITVGNRNFLNMLRVMTANTEALRFETLRPGVHRLEIEFEKEEGEALLGVSDTEDSEGETDLADMGFGPEELATMLSLGFFFETDGEVIEHNATNHADNRYVWEIPLFSEALEGPFVGYIVFGMEEPVSKGQTLRTSIESGWLQARQTEGDDFYGEALREFELLRGTGEGLKLDQPLTRAEGAMVYARLLGLEKEIQAYATTLDVRKAPFSDLPDWAAPTITYLHANGLVQGVGGTLYGSDRLMSKQQFSTLLLRSLGYDDQKGTEETSFSWESAFEKAILVGLFSGDRRYEEYLNTGEGRGVFSGNDTFLRGDMSYIAYNYLFFSGLNDSPGIERISTITVP